MKVIKVNSKSMMPCRCLVSPCVHFTMADKAILLPKTEETKNLVLNYFNFATFILHFIHTLRMNEEVFIKKILRRVRNYKIFSQNRVIYSINVNQADSSGKTALHYACWYNIDVVIKFLMSSPGINVNLLDNEGLPAPAYAFYDFDFPVSRESKLRIEIANKSKKLFNYLFNNIVPESWSSFVFEYLKEVDTWYLLSDEQKRKVIYNIRDEKGNTLLHYAAKKGKGFLIQSILRYDINTQYVRNIKGKLPINYCKNNYTFNCFDNTGEFYKQNFFNTYVFDTTLRNGAGYIYMYFPDIIAHFNDTTPYICSNLLNFVPFMSYINPEIVTKISTYARDTAKNTLFHIVALWNIELQTKLLFYYKLDPAIINEQNDHGSTVLHMCKSDEERFNLIQMGAHPDVANSLKNIPIKKANGNEIIMCSLQCLAARKVNVKYAPYPLKKFVQLHNPEKKDFNYTLIQKI